MGHYTGPKARINRRLGALVFESNGARKASEAREFPPGMHQRRRKVTDYGVALAEKQKIKYYYGLREKQLRRCFDKARRMKGNTGENLLILCERRLDNVVRRAGFCVTRPQARQGVAHGHFCVNGHKVDIPSFVVSPGDVISVRNRPNLKTFYTDIAESAHVEPTEWIAFDTASLEARVLGIPGPHDVSLPVDIGIVVAFLSR